jgi:nucleoside-diphosphate-sugar epimerase/choline dehydrogenase-like flavoprotein
MLSDALNMPHDPLHAQLCIVGAGAAGLTLAARMADLGWDVILLEAGSNAFNPASQRFFEGEVVDPSVHWPLDTFRVRALGGTSLIWGGRAIPYDPIDFERRDWVPVPGWPIRYDEVARYYPLAQEAAEAGRFDLTPSAPIIPGLESEWLHTTIERFSRPTNFWTRYGAKLTAAPNVRIVTNAAVTAIRTNQDGNHVDHLEFALPGGVRRVVTANRIVLAAGGLETARLLMVSNHVLAGGLGNGGGWLGRGYMCHIAATFGEVRLSGPPRSIGFDYERDADGIYLRRRLALTELTQRELGLLNFTARLHLPDPQDPSHRNAVLSLIFLSAFAVKYEYSRAMREADRTVATMLRHVGNIARDPFRLVNFARTWGLKRYLSSRRIPSIALFARDGRYPLEIHSEQAPNPESRVTLATDTDANGVNRLRVDWRVTPLDFRTVREACGLISRELKRTGTGTMTFDDAGLEAAILRAGAYGGHHSGTARMSASPADGVVDSDCRVHGVDNLFVASSAVLPTSSQANPTLTILALALRLADHLDELRIAETPARSAPPVLITGAAGFVGRAVTRRLAIWNRVRAGVRAGGSVDGGMAVQCDLLAPDTLDKAVAGASAIVHCAVGSPDTHSVTIDGTRNLLAAARRHSVKHVIFLSSVAVYGDVEGVMDEDADTSAPAGGYGRAKLAAEELCREAAGPEMAVTVLRCSLIYGPGSAQWTNSYLDRLRTGAWHKLGSDGAGTCNLLYVDDLAECIAALVASPPAGFAVFNVNGTDLPTWNAYIGHLADYAGVTSPVPSGPPGRGGMLMRLAMRSLDRVGMGGWLSALRERALVTPSRDELARFSRKVVYSTQRIEAYGYVPRTRVVDAVGRLTTPQVYGPARESEALA